MAYLLDADRGEASWVTRDRHLDAWTSQFIGPNAQPKTVEYGLFPPSPGFSSPAPILNLPALTVEPLAKGDDARSRSSRLHDREENYQISIKL